MAWCHQFGNLLAATRKMQTIGFSYRFIASSLWSGHEMCCDVCQSIASHLCLPVLVAFIWRRWWPTIDLSLCISRIHPFSVCDRISHQHSAKPVEFIPCVCAFLLILFCISLTFGQLFPHLCVVAVIRSSCLIQSKLEMKNRQQITQSQWF